MKLSDYRRAEKLTATEMGRRLGVSHSTVLRLESRSMTPSRSLVETIVKITDGRVQPNDLFAASEPSAAA